MTSPRPMIENSDRGITLNKQLAWTILSALVVGGMWIGSTVTGLQGSTRNLSEAISETRSTISAERQSNSALEQRIRILENTSSRQDARFDALNLSLEEVKSAQRETNTLLRQINTTSGKHTP